MEQISPRLLDFDQNRNETAVRDAATVVVLRDGDGGLEVLCVRRHARSGFLGGALVFPGGKVDASDGHGVWGALAAEPRRRASAFATGAAPVRALAIAACRETLEEAGILPADAPLTDGEVGEIAREVAAATPEADPLPPLATALQRRGLRLALGELVPWARWITPPAEARRFDTRFFLLALPAGQVGRHDNRETTMSLWATPARVLDRAARGEFFLAPPTSRTLELLAGAPDLHHALALAERQGLLPICASFVPGEGGYPPYLALPGDPSHALCERRVDGPTRFVLRDGRFVSEDAPPGARQSSPPSGET